jgi:cobyrinic acid a,c-diamide synthase
VPGNEWGGAAEKVQAIAGRIEACVDLDRIYAIAGAAAPLEAIARTADALPAGDRTPLKIGIARDSAFGFYYPDDLEAMQAAGAELVFFDTLKDRSLPRVDGVFIGGGFPETHIEELAANTGMLSSLKTAIDLGTPVYAECGGLMYLARRLHSRGVARYMAGALDFDVEMHERPQGRGYIRLQDTASHPWRRYAEDPEAPAQIAAHEFHYSAVVDPGAHPLEFAYDVKRGRGIDGRHDGVMRNNLFASYAHLRNTRAYRWTDRFLAFVRDRRRT